MAPTLPDLPTVETAVIEITNAYRRQHNLQDVRQNTQLTLAARAYAAYLAKTSQFSHTADGRQAGDRVAAGGYQWCQVAENLALHIDSRGFESGDLAKKSVEGWINSPVHRANLEAPNVTEIGVGVARAPGADMKFISVQLFARPKSMRYEFQISNATKQTITYTFGGKTHQVSPSYAITHTACNPSALTIDKPGSSEILARYEARDGVVYTLKPDPVQGLRVDVSTRHNVKETTR